MKNNETGEFELVLGNRQLLSGFFIVVILFAVFFVMGYIVGRNSAPTTIANVKDTTTSAVTPPVARTQSAPVSEPARDDPRAAEPVAPPVPAKTETPAAAAAAPAEAAAEGTYLQVTAVKQEVAETVAKTLKDKGFPSVLSPGPPGKTRVLVGPYADLSKLGQAKAELERLGFSPFVKK